MSRLRFFGRQQRPLHSLIPASDYIIQPAVDATVERLPGGQLRVRWTAVADTIHIYASDLPHKIDQSKLIATIKGKQEAIIPLWMSAVQPTFKLQFVAGAADGTQLVVAERVLNLQQGVNFRDIGGYRTSNGRIVRWGAVYRSGFMANLTANDLQTLAQLDLKIVCDFRSLLEAKMMPDQLPENPRPLYLPLPIISSTSRLRQVWAVFRQRNQLEQLLLHGYTAVMLQENAALIGDVLTRLAEPANLPMVVHCTAGKDRTGVFVALLLALLGVPDETIIADYTLSNAHFAEYAPTLEKDISRLTRLGLGVEKVRPFLIADPMLMQATLTYLYQQFGSVENYVRQKVGLDQATINQIRANLLL